MKPTRGSIDYTFRVSVADDKVVSRYERKTPNNDARIRASWVELQQSHDLSAMQVQWSHNNS